MANGPYDLPQSIFDFIFIPNIANTIDDLARLAETEDWDYHNTSSDRDKPILNNYLKYTYVRISEEKKLSVSQDELFSIWNTGLITKNQEQIFMLSEKCKFTDCQQYWHYKGFIRQGERDVNKFTLLPDMAHYFEDPSLLVYDTRKELRANIEHIIEDNKFRFPADLQMMSNFALQNIVKGSLDNVKERVKRNYKTAIPQYHNGAIQLLLPLCLKTPEKADLAIVVERFSDFYRAATCLTLDMAYNNARQISRPDREWLQP